jgi:hypothetical protein
MSSSLAPGNSGFASRAPPTTPRTRRGPGRRGAGAHVPAFARTPRACRTIGSLEAPHSKRVGSAHEPIPVDLVLGSSEKLAQPHQDGEQASAWGAERRPISRRQAWRNSRTGSRTKPGWQPSSTLVWARWPIGSCPDSAAIAARPARVRRQRPQGTAAAGRQAAVTEPAEGRGSWWRRGPRKVFPGLSDAEFGSAFDEAVSGTMTEGPIRPVRRPERREGVHLGSDALGRLRRQHRPDLASRWLRAAGRIHRPTWVA